ncbi:hypothetical protein NEMIN01_1560 [Nematocida minor]|uniref:uncharacterized protein n=1 Tax=Nematocida minor TaxID=1912983 RepID=UPI00221E51B2|nr:uncharacterized protein NEMIN01_1560 [Nematocida minor]KAI5191534.1 hypothetical protein NEMIN01_1560 [Nematocida minor]
MDVETLDENKVEIVFNVEEILKQFQYVCMPPIGSDLSLCSEVEDFDMFHRVFNSNITARVSTATPQVLEMIKELLELRLYYDLKYDDKNAAYSQSMKVKDALFTKEYSKRSIKTIKDNIHSSKIVYRNNREEKTVKTNLMTEFNLWYRCLQKIRDVYINEQRYIELCTDTLRSKIHAIEILHLNSLGYHMEIIENSYDKVIQKSGEDSSDGLFTLDELYSKTIDGVPLVDFGIRYMHENTAAIKDLSYVFYDAYYAKEKLELQELEKNKQSTLSEYMKLIRSIHRYKKEIKNEKDAFDIIAELLNHQMLHLPSALDSNKHALSKEEMEDICKYGCIGSSVKDYIDLVCEVCLGSANKEEWRKKQDELYSMYRNKANNAIKETVQGINELKEQINRHFGYDVPVHEIIDGSIAKNSDSIKMQFASFRCLKKEKRLLTYALSSLMDHSRKDIKSLDVLDKQLAELSSLQKQYIARKAHRCTDVLMIVPIKKEVDEKIAKIMLRVHLCIFILVFMLVILTLPAVYMVKNRVSELSMRWQLLL